MVMMKKFKIQDSKFKIPQFSIFNFQSLMRKKGFTLMELMVVIAIIVLLAGIMVPNLANRLERAKITKAEADIASIESAIAMYETDTGTYPPPPAGISTNEIDYLDTFLTGNDKSAPPTYSPAYFSNSPNWHGPYIKGIEKDPWGNDYVYLKNSAPRALPPLYTGQTPGTDLPNIGDGGCVAPARNLSYYIYSFGKNRRTGGAYDNNPTDVSPPDYNNDDINNWDVNKSWREAK